MQWKETRTIKQALNIVFWGMFFALNWMLAFYVLIPAVNNIGLDICDCSDAEYSLDQTQVENCKGKVKLMCDVGVIFVWISAYLVSFVFLYAVFVTLLLLFGIARAKYIRVGNVQDWNDVERFWGTILKRSLPEVSKSLTPLEPTPQQIKNGDYVTDDRFVMNEGLSLHQSTVWNCLVDSLYRDDLLSSDEMDALKVSIKTDLESRQLVPNFRLKPRSKEAQRRVISYMWGLESLAAHDGHHEKAILKGGDFTSGLRKSHRVYAMPSFTTIVPIYNEAILLSRENIKRMRDHGKSAKRITELEYLALVYSAEWQNFAQKMDNKHSGSWILDKKQKENLANELLHAFIGQEHPKPLEDKKDAQLIRDIELWASMRGQTLARTIKGLCNIRLGIEQLCVLEEPDMTPRQIMMLVARKYQILISHQTFNLSLVGQNDGKLSQQENALVHMFRTEKYLEVVTNDDTVFQSHCLKLRDVLLYPPKENDIRHRDPRKTMEAIENETAKLQTKINLQFDTLMKWYGNKSTVLPEGTMVRMNNTGTWEKKNQKDIGRPDMKKLFGGKWQEGVVMKFTPAPVVSELRKFTPDELQSVQESRRLSPSLDTAKKLQLLGLEVCPSDNGVLVKRDTGIVFSFNVTGYTLTKYEIKMENTNTTVKNEPTTDNFLEAMCDTGKEVSFTFTRIPGWGDSNMGKYEIKLDNGDTQKDVLFDRVEPFPWTCQTVQRVSPLKIGEGKAENQIHALPFARGDVLQAMDMNQYATSDQGMKIPFLLNDFFSTPDEKTLSACMNGDDGWDHNILIPPFRIVGFPENCYTRDLSMVGELMGAAEWCFVTINQRVLSWPLRTRAHYGHPDFFDGYWARTRGGTSKASLKVNTNEDIFAGYEMLGRGERGSYVEFLEVHKGRETAFPNAYGFEVKLAQGAAQQIRSLDIYMLNRKLDLFSRFSLFYGSLAFYVTNFIMAISINYYILSIVLFAMSGVSYHQLGLMDAIIAIPWLLQVGYVLAIPMIVELVLQKGFLRGVVEFIVTLPIAVFFFIFHMRTKTYYFGKGLLVGSGGYVATGRGFGLERQNMKEMYQTYSESHFLEDPIVPYLARTFTIILITISWLWAPIIFNPMPTTQELQSDLSAMMDWISTKVRHCTVEEADKMDRALQSVQKARELTLEYNMTEETTEEKDASNANETTVIGDADSSSGYDSDSGGAVGRNPEEEKKKWFALLYHNEHTSFTWKPGIKKNPLVPNIDARKKEVFVSVEGQCDIPNIGLDFKEQVLKELKTKEKPTDTELEQKNIMVLSFKDEAAVKGLGDLPKEFDLAVGNNMRARVKVETFAQWSQNRIPSFKSYEEMVAQYWKTENGKRNTADESWKAWYIQYVVFKMWQSEDEHSKTPVQFISTTIIKVYLYAEFYLPWVLISFAFWNMESLWLVIVGVFLAGLFYVIDYNTRDRHDYPQLIKAITLLMLPFAYMYYSTALITAKELFWSAVFYVLGLTIIARIAMGVRNIEARDVGVDAETSGNSIEDARRSDVTRLNNKEAREAKVFYKRLMIWPGWIAFRSITPFCIMVLLAIGNFLAVALSTWLTAMLYNGAVAEAWRKAYFSSSSATPPPPSDSPGPRGFSNVVLETAPSPIAQATIDAVNTSTGKKIKKKVNRGKQAHGVRSARNVTTIQESDNNAGVEEAF